MTRVAVTSLLAGLLALGLAAVTVVGASAQTAGSVEVSTLYPSVVVQKKDKVTFTVNVANTSGTPQSFDLVVADAPKGWESLLKAQGFTVRRMYLAAGKNQDVDFQVMPPATAEPQDYNFLVKALGAGGAELSALKLTVGIQPLGAGGVKLTTDYPMLRGPSSTKFTFKANLVNNADENRNYNLSATAPQGWEVSFKPSYEQTQISSLSTKSGDSKSIDIEVLPPAKAPAGEYNIKVSAAGGGDKADVELKVTLTGTYEMSLTTPTGRLNAQATAGQQSPFSLDVSNLGSADLQKITLSSSKPDGWEVKFDPDSIDALQAGAMREVNVQVKPSAKAIAGDYVLSISASTPQASKSVDVRVTVETSSLWGWLGAGVIVVVMGGLYGIFRIYGRR